MPGNIFQLANNPNEALALAGTFKYPSSLGNSSKFPYTVFMPYKRPSGLAGFTSIAQGAALYDRTPAPDFAVALPTPASAMKTQYQATYDTIEVGQAIGMALQGAAAAGNAKTGEEFFNSIATNVGDALKSVPTALAKTAAAAFGGSAQAVDIFTGTADNPYTENVFKNVAFRTHSFSYTFMPKNEVESQTLDAIIRVFKFAMLPTPGLLGYFEFPYEFQILHSNQDKTFLLMPSVLETFDVDFGGGTDTMKSFNSRYPAKISLSMTFKEMVLLSRDRMDSPLTLNDAPTGAARYRF